MEKNATNVVLVSEIKTLIEQSKQQLAVVVNATMSELYWRIGKRINQELIHLESNEKYGKQIVATLWRQLESEYGSSFSEKNLRRMMQFAKVFPDEKIVVSMIRNLSWSHIKELLQLDKTNFRVAEYLTLLPPQEVL
ncbi:MAG: DUF1016 family protein [Flavobacteriales bacterium]|nr:DUF1016 family protein [Crocinitomicaceae bacterium]NBX79402.1 DUF1016 family protein [Flavobacteriales bacterium]